MLINRIEYVYTKYELDLFPCTINLKNERLKPFFLLQNHLLTMCTSAVNSQRLLCRQKADVKCLYYIVLVYKCFYK